MILTMKKIIFTLTFTVLMGSLNLKAQSDTEIVTLSQCINAALNYNPLIKQASNEVIASKFALKIAESGYYRLFQLIYQPDFQISTGLITTIKKGMSRFRLINLCGKKGRSGTSLIRRNTISCLTTILWSHRRQTSLNRLKQPI